jgi:pimeloyl-ACP methyl ester carboxylesterase
MKTATRIALAAGSLRLRTTAAITAALALAVIVPSASAADTQLLLVHGHGDAAAGRECNGGTWKDALAYYQQAGGRERSSLTTIGYYAGDKGRCDVIVGDGKASNERPIQDIARDLAKYIDRQGRPVDVIGHSMGGLIVRVALLGSAQAWEGFPAHRLDVDDVITLGTPHQGVARPPAHANRQWRQMRPGSGFLDRLHERGSGLGDAWAQGTDWSLIGSKEDDTVSHDSAIDKGEAADQKYGYQDNPRDSGDVTHTGLRTLHREHRHDLNFWHASGDHGTHHTRRGWAPLKAAFKAATHVGDDLPR